MIGSKSCHCLPASPIVLSVYAFTATWRLQASPSLGKLCFQSTCLSSYAALFSSPARPPTCLSLLLCLPDPLLPLFALPTSRTVAFAREVDIVRLAKAALLFAYPAIGVADLLRVSMPADVGVVVVAAAVGRGVLARAFLLTVTVGGDLALGFFGAEVC
jgi:hypothetical protein